NYAEQCKCGSSFNQYLKLIHIYNRVLSFFHHHHQREQIII
ncbi:unnamed protein product, partial [Rotaria sp. Silwood2]